MSQQRHSEFLKQADGLTVTPDASAPVVPWIDLDSYHYTAGQRVYSPEFHVEFVPGDCPVIIALPHGGYLTPAEIPDRPSDVSVSIDILSLISNHRCRVVAWSQTFGRRSSAERSPRHLLNSD